MTTTDDIAAAATGRAQQAAPFYAGCIDASELIAARGVEGVDEELALLRVQLHKLVIERPEEFALMVKGIEVIVRIVAARYRMSPKRAYELGDNLARIVRDIGAQVVPERFEDV